MCGNFKSLDLVRARLADFASHDILSQLKNMPTLQNLVLDDFRFTLMDLEMVHCSIPSIKRLCMKILRTLSGDFPIDIIPAALITELDISLIGADDKHTHIEFYTYMAKKYPSISKYNCVDYLISVKSNDYIRDVYNKGNIPLYQSIGSKINRFSFDNYCGGLDAFRKFNESGIKLKQLKIETLPINKPLFMEELAQSQQSKYIQILGLSCAVPEPLDMMRHMEVLKYLNITFRDKGCIIQGRMKPRINFSQFIKAFPATLTHLITVGVNFTFSESTSNVTSIRFLRIEETEVMTKTTTTWTSFPKLSQLYLEPIVRSNLTISLPRTHLKEAAIHIKYTQDEKCAFSVEAMNEGKLQRSVV
jgi:hypothetical protein